MADMVSILHDEGLEMAMSSDIDLLGHDGGPRWDAAVNKIYDETELTHELRQQFRQSLQQSDLADLCNFYKREEMQDIIQHEISARRAFLDVDVEQDARERWLQGDTPEDLDDIIGRYIDKNDLIELNVMGALNSNFVFLSRLNQSLPDSTGHMTEDEILTHVWSQESDIRTDTSEWMYAYLHTAYERVDEGALARYVAFSETPTGQALNQALFSAFDAVYLRLSSDLGSAVGVFSQEEEL
ncbi:hypothetical protein [Aliiroseovarius sp. F20344]|uniref:hypothetical protein n=1 Tax=Aliiroseovarius sp. F20344 TaxID=2926414 RepID=UPI001FF2096E|nr:hypothetical protein [Aliiroseovarius sp. F20344]MCK0143709.1 hypothetical protein [Aliiroseovarius sp. F20344]